MTNRCNSFTVARCHFSGKVDTLVTHLSRVFDLFNNYLGNRTSLPSYNAIFQIDSTPAGGEPRIHLARKTGKDSPPAVLATDNQVRIRHKIEIQIPLLGSDWIALNRWEPTAASPVSVQGLNAPVAKKAKSETRLRSESGLRNALRAMVTSFSQRSINKCSPEDANCPKYAKI
jgi:hypothetical protein